jgi:hypothetical protein
MVNRLLLALFLALSLLAPASARAGEPQRDYLGEWARGQREAEASGSARFAWLAVGAAVAAVGGAVCFVGVLVGSAAGRRGRELGRDEFNRTNQAGVQVYGSFEEMEAHKSARAQTGAGCLLIALWLFGLSVLLLGFGVVALGLFLPG